MNFSCVCGARIYDNTDYQEDKAYFISDQSHEKAMMEIENRNTPWGVLRKFERIMYQCRSCARLWLEDQQGNLTCFTPDPKTEFGILTDLKSK
jgi:hypothetical protein